MKRLISTFLSLPITIFLDLLIAVNDVLYLVLFSWSTRLFIKKKPRSHQPLKKNASLIILNWNGRHLLEECLPSVIEAVRFSEGDHEIIIADNGSTDDSVNFVKINYPQVQIIKFNQNYSYIGGYNRAIQEIKKDIVVLLNNDMFVDKDFLNPLLDGFSDDQVFAVSSQIFFENTDRRREETGKTRTVWRRGMVGYSHDIPNEIDLKQGYSPAFWMGGGSCAVDRQKFLEIGGFDALLKPLYMEDVDISYRAWKRGWKVLFCPESKVIHKHRSTSGRLNKAYLERVIQRNRLLFIWKNITQPGMVFQHLLALPLIAMRNSWQLNTTDTLQVLLMALERLPEALWKRNIQRTQSKISDSKVFSVANDPYEFKQYFISYQNNKHRGDRLKILFLTPYFPSLLHGGGVRMYQMIRALSKYHDIYLISFWDNPKDRTYFDALEQFCHRVIRILRYPSPHSLSISYLPPAISIDFGDVAFQQSIKSLLIAEDFDIVQCEYLQTAYQLPHINRETLILTNHEVQSAAAAIRLNQAVNPTQWLHRFIQWARWLVTETGLSKGFDQVITLTPEDGWYLKRYAPELPIRILPTGIDLEYFSPSNAQNDANHIVFVGNFLHTPNVDSAFFLVNDILPLVKQQIPDIRLSLVGANPPPEIRAMAKENQIFVTGWVDDIRPYLNQATLAVFPIRQGVGLRNKIIEAWAMGKAVITTPLGSAGLEPKHGENIWIAENATEFADSIIHLLNNPNVVRTLGKNARSFLEQYRSWDAIAKKQTDLYWEAIETRNLSIKVTD